MFVASSVYLCRLVYLIVRPAFHFRVAVSRVVIFNLRLGTDSHFQSSLRKGSQGRLKPELTTLLSPFDPLVWDRARARAAFGFDYRLECYTPGPKRRYGYFALPILRRGGLVGRLDAKAHRKEGVFEVKSVHLEQGVGLCDELLSDVGAAIRECAVWHKTPDVLVRQSGQAGVAKGLMKVVGR